MDFEKKVAEYLSSEGRQNDLLRILVRKAQDNRLKELFLQAILESPRHQGDILFVDDNLPAGSLLSKLIPDALAEYNKADPHNLHQV